VSIEELEELSIMGIINTLNLSYELTLPIHERHFRKNTPSHAYFNDDSLISYKKDLIELIKNMSKVEKILYGIKS
jgi:hypothetical protein